ncbi:hypothetical protein [Streptomyces aureoverticillatus]|uniref:hypothetical protein n=1 Tax=Streptomyces aureoverticillatus TaxID=66871 RepID=UPI0013DC4AB8|nr:hypothetical protein [Streptomyces aureoverticillatus]QIB46410.1 hypothetical protein G3H79_28390 [Streptomyces aureoverticillatus]
MGTARLLELDTLVRLSRERERATGRRVVSVQPVARLAVPAGMRQPLGCDAVAMPAEFGPRLLERLPRVGCVYEDGPRWWWIVPADSDVALEWPPSTFYSPGAVVPDAVREPVLVHRPDDTVPYTPPIPLYLALCRMAGAMPSWAGAVRA